MITVAFIAGLLWGALLMYWFLHRGGSLERDQLQAFMQRVVNIENLEEHEKLIKLRMERNRRKTTRTDSGPNAKMMRLKVRRPGRRG